MQPALKPRIKRKFYHESLPELERSRALVKLPGTIFKPEVFS